MRALYSVVAVVGLGVASAAFAPSAKAGDWSVGVQVGLPGLVVASPPPDYYVPPPRYYAPRPVYEPGYYAPPRYYRPPVVVYEGRYCHDRGWHHYRHHDRDDDE
jgi:hypothetical protein